MANQIFVLFYRFDQSNLLKGIDNKTVREDRDLEG